jgi:hypothetical protein
MLRLAAIGQRYANIPICTQQGQAGLFEELANGNIDMIFVSQGNTGRKPSFTGSRLLLQNKFDVLGIGTFDKQYNHYVLIKTI